MKLAKLSLAAIMAAGAFSFASATPLTDAIKGVDLSGMLRLRFYNEDRGSSNISPNYNRYRSSEDFQFTVPVSDTFKFIYKLEVESNTKSNGNQWEDGGSTEGSVSNNLAYLNYASNGLNVIAGRIPVKTSITTSGHGETRGSGAIATYGVGNGLTFAGAFLDSTNTAGAGADVGAAAVLYNSNMAGVQAWYYRITNVSKYIFTLSTDVKPVAGLNIHGEYAAAKDDTVGASNHSFYNVNASYAMNGFSVLGGYATTNKNAGTIYLNGDSQFASTLPTANNYAIANGVDLDAYYAKLAYSISGATKVYGAYGHVKNNPNTALNYNDYTLGGSYKYNKKLGFTAYYDVFDSKTNTKDSNELRFEAKYSF